MRVKFTEEKCFTKAHSQDEIVKSQSLFAITGHD